MSGMGGWTVNRPITANVDAAIYINQHVTPAALSFLPARMDSIEARAFLVGIGLQESRFRHRVQVPNGPAHGFWQFEKNGGVKGVLRHTATRPLLLPILETFCYRPLEQTCYDAIVHNDVLACIFARLLLWTVPGRLPMEGQADIAWQQYLDGWRPGKPHHETWPTCYAEAWRIVTQE